MKHARTFVQFPKSAALLMRGDTATIVSTAVEEYRSLRRLLEEPGCISPTVTLNIVVVPYLLRALLRNAVMALT